MTEEEWLTNGECEAALAAGRTVATDRKLYLLSIACIRLLDRSEEEAANALAAFERAADFKHPRLAMINAGEAFSAWFGFQEGPWRLAEFALAERWPRWADESNCVPLFRDIFGNPFRPVAFDPEWRTETVVGIARDIYEDRAFERVPILADAIEEAGCDNADILSHCREPGVHVRGCWVVDLLLGKS